MLVPQSTFILGARIHLAWSPRHFFAPNVAYYFLLPPAPLQRLTHRVHGANNETAQPHSPGSADVFRVQPLLPWIALALVAKTQTMAVCHERSRLRTNKQADEPQKCLKTASTNFLFETRTGLRTASLIQFSRSVLNGNGFVTIALRLSLEGALSELPQVWRSLRTSITETNHKLNSWTKFAMK